MNGVQTGEKFGCLNDPVDFSLEKVADYYQCVPSWLTRVIAMLAFTTLFVIVAFITVFYLLSKNNDIDEA